MKKKNKLSKGFLLYWIAFWSLLLFSLRSFWLAYTEMSFSIAHTPIYGILDWILLSLPIFGLILLLVIFKKYTEGFNSKWKSSGLMITTLVFLILSLIPFLGLLFSPVVLILGLIIFFKDRNFLGLVAVAMTFVIRMIEVFTLYFLDKVGVL